MELSTNELLNFIRCPFYYRFKWVVGSPILKIKAQEHWKNCLYSTALGFFKEWATSGILPSAVSLQESWQRAWFPTDHDVALDFTSSQRKTKQTLGTDGWLNLLHMHRYFSANPIPLAGVDYPYSITLGNNTLSGKIDILTYTNPEKTRMMGIKLCTSSYEATKMYGYNGLEMVAYRMAIKEFLEKIHGSASKKDSVKAELGFYVLENVNKPFYTTRRTEEQEEVLINTVDSVCSAIANQIYFPDFGYKCHNCDFKPRCNKGKWIETEN